MGKSLKILIIAKAKMKSMISSKVFILVMLILPMVFVYAIGTIYSPDYLSGGIPIAIVDEDHSQYSRFLMDLLKEEEIIQVIEVDEKTAYGMVADNVVEGAYVIKNGFEDLIRSNNYPSIEVIKSSGSYGAEAITEIISSGVVRLISNARAANTVVGEYKNRGLITDEEIEKLWQEVYEKSESYWYPQQLMELDYTAVYYGEEVEPRGIVAGATEGPIGILVSFLALFLGYGLISILKEREEGTLRRMYIISSSSMTIIIGNAVAMFLVAMFHVVILLSGFHYLLKISFGISLSQIILILAAYSLLWISMIIYLAAMVKHSNSIQSLYAVGVIITSMIGGCFWSLDLLPKPIQTLALFTPQGLTMVSMRFMELGEVTNAFRNIGMMFVVSCLLFVLAGRKLKHCL